MQAAPYQRTERNKVQTLSSYKNMVTVLGFFSCFRLLLTEGTSPPTHLRRSFNLSVVVLILSISSCCFIKSCLSFLAALLASWSRLISAFDHEKKKMKRLAEIDIETTYSECDVIWVCLGSNTCSCCSFNKRPLCFFRIGGILSSSPLSLSLFFWCSSQASSVFVFSLTAFCRRRNRELWCCSLTSSSFMYCRTMSIVNWEKLSCPPEKDMLASRGCRETNVEKI